MMDSQSDDVLISDRISILREVEIFSETSDNVLLEIASFLKEMKVKQGQNVFKKGEDGDAMFIRIVGSEHGQATLSADGRTLYFSSNAKGTPAVYRKAVEGAGEVELRAAVRADDGAVLHPLLAGRAEIHAVRSFLGLVRWT